MDGPRGYTFSITLAARHIYREKVSLSVKADIKVMKKRFLKNSHNVLLFFFFVKKACFTKKKKSRKNFFLTEMMTWSETPRTGFLASRRDYRNYSKLNGTNKQLP